MTNDWIEWRGGLCPVDANAEIDIMLRDGAVYSNCEAGNYIWSHEFNEGDIVSFRFADDYQRDRTVQWKSQSHRPVHAETVVEIVLESGDKSTRHARATNWNAQDVNPIIAFRIVKPEGTQNIKEKKKTKTLKVLTEEGLELQEEFESLYGKTGSCSCHTGHPPCSSCTHPGHPISIEESEHFWRTVEVEEELPTPSKPVDLLWGSW